MKKRQGYGWNAIIDNHFKKGRSIYCFNWWFVTKEEPVNIAGSLLRNDNV